MTTSRFTIGDDAFLLDGRPHRILSGALHYFRIHPEHWADRIHKARLLGLNTIETYVPWNDHAPTPDEWITDGRLDLGAFLDLVHEAGMHAIVRPGPYICAEYDNGGLPGWLFRDPSVGVRRSEPLFLAAVETYLRRVYEIVVPRQIDHGGPVVLVQIENEYGAYGSDAAYLRALVDLTRDAGIDVPLTTVDQPEPDMLHNGSLPDLLKTGSFGSRSPERLATLRAAQPTGPLMSSEYWNGWFDHWGGVHHTTPAEAQARDLDELLALGASVNLYMVHGGTNFGFTNGANDKGVYEPTITSYDYDAPIDEAGRLTEKYFAFREVFAKYTDVPDLDFDDPRSIEDPTAHTPAPVPVVEMAGSTPLLGVLGRLGHLAPASAAPTFDELGVYRGYLVLRAALPDAGSPTSGESGGHVLEVGEVRDRAIVFVDGVRIGVLERARGDRRLALPAGAELIVLLEDQGRVNYDQRIGEPKGLIGEVTVDGRTAEWTALPLDLDLLAASGVGADPSVSSSPLVGPGIARFEFSLGAPADLFLDSGGLGKGVAFVNGFPLGRYWSDGPQRTLYVPGPATRSGANELVLFETEVDAPRPAFAALADLGPARADAFDVQGA
ncbi:beta-galactosidase family protein [Frondihabitans sp. 4ASC-45]|uniref:glycoside hydrolase family 35 protein n=1 Tax=Frondihabitans sp. 4ASC-45 TaxID=3111636 RepID=UPI003C1517A9